jgi:hypothetical protein
MRTEHALRMLIWPVGELSLHLSYDARLIGAADAVALMDRYVEILSTVATGRTDEVADLVTDPWGGTDDR